MIQLAWRNLWQHRGRLVMAVGGVGLALTLILALDAILNGMEGQISRYIERSEADVWVAQEGVRNLHMVTSTLPANTVTEVSAVPGVAAVTPLLYVSYPVVAGRASRLAYVIGLPTDATMGGPWEIVAGSPNPDNGEVVLGTGLADALGVGTTDEVGIFGQAFRVSGLSRQGETLGSSVVFIAAADFARYRRSGDTVSFVLARLEPGATPSAVAQRIEKQAGVSATTRSAFALNERRVVKDMGADVVEIMNLIGFIVGAVSTSLIIYLATLARRAEYGVLKALGANTRHLTGLVLAQAGISAGLGLALATLVTLALALLLPRAGAPLALALSTTGVAKAAGAALVMAALAAMLPVWQLARLDPARVFRGGTP